MENNLTIALALVGVALVGMLLMLTTPAPDTTTSDTPSFAVATLQDLKRYPLVTVRPSQPGELGKDVVVRLPDNDLVVVLRPISRETYNSFQVQAIAPELIEWQMLAAALQSPAVDEVDFSALPTDLVLFLKTKVNEISGFSVFETD